MAPTSPAPMLPPCRRAPDIGLSRSDASQSDASQSNASCSRAYRGPSTWRQPERWPETLVETDLPRIADAWRALRHGRRGWALRTVQVAQRRLRALAGATAVWPEATERLQRQASVWTRLRSVGLALLDLPGLDRAFHMEQLAWAKVEQVARVATLEHEAAWIVRARALDVRSLARLVLRSPRGGPPPEADEPANGNRAETSELPGAPAGTWSGIAHELVRIELGAGPSRRGALAGAGSSRRARLVARVRRGVAILVERVRSVRERLAPWRAEHQLRCSTRREGPRLGASSRMRLRPADAPNVRQTVRVGFSTA